jgi:hypothetical protein
MKNAIPLNGRLAMAFAMVLLTISSASNAQAQDFRADFPEQYTDTPLGVNLQSGRFSYWLFSFAMGPFVTQRGFSGSGFDFPASIYVFEQQSASGLQTNLSVNMGNPAVSLGNRVELVQVKLRTFSDSWLRGVNSSTIQFRESIYNGTSNGFTNVYSPGSEGWRVERITGGYILTHKSGNRYHFTDTAPVTSGFPSARIAQIELADGGRTDVTWDSLGRLSFVSSNRGFALRYEYLSGGAQVKICGFNSAREHVTANTPCSASSLVVTINNEVRSDGILKPLSVVDVMGQTSTIQYGGYNNNFPVCITLPNSATCEVTNHFGPLAGELPQLTKRDMVRVQTDAGGNVYNYGYDFPIPATDDPPQQPGGPPVLSSSWMNAPGYYVEAYYENGLVKRLDAPGAGSTLYSYNGAVLQTATQREGNALKIDRDWNGNPEVITEIPKPGSGLANAVSTQVFPAPVLGGMGSLCTAASHRLCDKPSERTDPASNKTEFTYDPAHGGVLTKTLPGVQVGGTGPLIRPVVRYEYAQRYAWLRNGSGGYSPAATAIWLPLRERTCRTSATVNGACAGGTADETVTEYDYGPDSGPNNLLLRGVAVTADGVTLRTCYGYDAQGRKISETQPAAGLAVCP